MEDRYKKGFCPILFIVVLAAPKNADVYYIETFVERSQSKCKKGFCANMCILRVVVKWYQRFYHE